MTIETLLYQALLLIQFVTKSFMNEHHSVVIHFFGYDEDKGVMPSSFVLEIDNRSTIRKCTFPKQSNKEQYFENDQVEFENAMTRNFSELLNGCDKVNISVQIVSVDENMTDALKIIHQQLHNELKRLIWRDWMARPRKGPKLENNELFTSPLIGSTLSLSFNLFPNLLSTSIEVIGKQRSNLSHDCQRIAE